MHNFGRVVARYTPVKKTLMTVAQYFGAFSVFLSLMSIWILVAYDFPADYFKWDQALRKRNAQLIDLRAWSSDGDLDYLSVEESSRSSSEEEEPSLPTFEDWTNASLRTKLGKSMANIEKDVLNLNVQLILRTLEEVPREQNRVVNKIQHAQWFPQEECVIRIAKYCSTKCPHIVGNYSRQWKRFSCSFASPCAVETRFVSEATREIMELTDVLIIVGSLHDGLRLNKLMARRPPGQLWMLFSRESPQHDPEYAPPRGNPYNISMTYSPDSDIFFPFCHLQRMHVHPPPLPKKTKLMTWMASNCHRLSWRRDEFVEELQKYLPIDTYGKCGTMGLLSDVEAEETLKQYKFYLALENSECQDYVTEKIWRTTLPNGILPVVYGARREDYDRILPNRSFIHVEDFDSMKEFAEFILKLDSNDKLYKSYFDWRRDGTVSCLSGRWFIMLNPEVNLCYLLRKLVHLHLHPEFSWQKKHPDFRSWWQGRCLDTDAKRNVLGFDVHNAKFKKKLRWTDKLKVLNITTT